MNSKTKTSITVFSLVMLITISVDSTRNLPATALFGNLLIFFFILAVIMFLIPSGLVSAQLSAAFPEEGGVYYWVRTAFGGNLGFLAVWLQWITALFWYPTILSYLAGTATFLFDPALANSKIYLVSVVLGVFWAITLINLKGFQSSARIAAACAIVGMILPMILIIVLTAIWMFSGEPLQLHITAHNIIPPFSHLESWVSLVAIMTGLTGMELATVHIRNIEGAEKKFPNALFWSVLIVAITTVFSALSIAFVLPTNKIDLVDGLMQAFSVLLITYHLSWLIPVIVITLLIGSLGTMINWIISPAKGLMQAAEQGYLPKFFQKENTNNVPTHILIFQAIFLSLICLVFLLMPTINASYWLLADLSTQFYMSMYVLVFLAAIMLRYKSANPAVPFHIPGGKIGYWITCLFGIIAASTTIIVGFFSPKVIDVGAPLHYEIIMISGILLMLLPLLFFYGYKRLARRNRIDLTKP